MHDQSPFASIDEKISRLIATYGENATRTRQLADEIYHESRSLTYPRGEAIGLRYIGNDLRLKANYAEAESALLEATEIVSKHCNESDQAFVLLGLASLYTDTNQVDRAVPTLESSADLFRRSNRPDGEAKASLMLANLHMVNDEHLQAIEASRAALVLYSNLQDEQGIANSFANLGNAYGMKGEYDRALEYFQLALKYFTEMKRPYNMAALHSNVGEIYSKQGDHTAALAHFDSALQTAIAHDFPYLVAAVRLNKFETLHKMGEVEAAEQEMCAVYRIAREKNASAILKQAEKLETMMRPTA
ncbi:MAG TPA: tetratricopeptide repeat protein [Candidatus Kapabacteria bacterium]|nr:tetratricopeptide repeat protein [Candidatus Kapabacteria bacterium]